ncbi:Clp protease N-terminal domain-containing protein [Streptomyces sp. NPDC019937]|uniref:Clp protease N-terminal domain-containing protein n=1 Tax=Streptomyces sp. NPDC019937 TaxID=3154787 RepID=UPI0033C44D07
MRSPALSASVDPAGAGFEDRLSEPLTAVVTGAHRRAVRDGDNQLDTAHLLHTLVENDPRVWGAFAGGPPQVARLLGYLVQRTIGYGLRWSGTVETSATGAGDEVPGWSPAAAAAMASAVGRAGARGAFLAEGPDLLAALTYDRECRAVEVLRRAGVDVDLLVTALDGAPCQARTG